MRQSNPSGAVTGSSARPTLPAMLTSSDVARAMSPRSAAAAGGGAARGARAWDLQEHPQHGRDGQDRGPDVAREAHAARPALRTTSRGSGAAVRRHLEHHRERAPAGRRAPQHERGDEPGEDAGDVERDEEQRLHPGAAGREECGCQRGGA